LDIILVEPEIPQNTGNIARTCVATGSRLHLVEPMGFQIDDKKLKRAGLDYWFDLELKIWPNLEECLRFFRDRTIYYSTTKADRHYAEVRYEKDSVVLFGKETKGLPESLLLAHRERCVRIPMVAGNRSLNLSNSVAIIVYEAMRQQDFKGLDAASNYLTAPL
jgi:tRNA (cytidine/uridine-2'-O-)-methyltransferase